MHISRDKTTEAIDVGPSGTTTKKPPRARASAAVRTVSGCSTQMVLVLAVMVFSGLILPVQPYSEGSDKLLGDGEDTGTTYGVIVDCGSSGTRANLYHWSNSLIYPALLNDIEPLRSGKDNKALSLKKEPGLSSMKDEPEKSSDYMKEIMQFITSNIPKEAQSATGVYIMATAGMRLLDEEIQQQIMSDIAKDISTRYNFAKIKTNVISGAQEGMYQWISVNSKAKRFAPAMEAGKKLDGKKTYALIEMGGASIQVAYQLQPDLGRKILSKLPRNTGVQPAFMSQIVEPNISQETQGHKYELHSTTFLGLGSNSARDNYLDMLITPGKRIDERIGHFFKKRLLGDNSESRKQPVVIKDPCMPVGSSEERKKPSRMLSRKETKTIGFLEEEGEDMFSVKVVGTGNYASCRKNVSKFLKLCKKEGLHCKPEETCTMHLLGTPFVPFEAYEFLGLGEFYYSTLSMMKLDGVYKHEDIVHMSKEMCELSIDELEKKYPDANNVDKDRSRTECFKAVFADTFLTEGLLMTHDYRNLKTVGKIGKDSVDWTLGAVLDKSLTIELAAEENEEADDDEFDDYQDYDDFEEAEEEQAFEEQVELKQPAVNNEHPEEDSDSLAAESETAQGEDNEEEKPRYQDEHSGDESALDTAKNLANAELDREEPLFKSSAPVHTEEEVPYTHSGSFEMSHELDHELAQLEQAERLNNPLDQNLAHPAGSQEFEDELNDLADLDEIWLKYIK